MEQNHVTVRNHLVLSILSTLFFCQLLGLVSVVYSGRVDACLSSGDVVGAKAAARRAVVWMVVNVVASILLAAIGLAVLISFTNG